MTREETKKILMAVSASYPNFKPADMKNTIDVWAVMLAEYSFEAIQIALKKYILSDTSGFAPSIGQLVGHMQSIARYEDMGELAAWALVSRAISNSGYNSAEEYKGLPATVRKAVGSPDNLREWALMDLDTVNSVIQSHFIRNYRSALKREREERILPPAFRERLKTTHGTSMLWVDSNGFMLQDNDPETSEDNQC